MVHGAFQKFLYDSSVYISYHVNIYINLFDTLLCKVMLIFRVLSHSHSCCFLITIVKT